MSMEKLKSNLTLIVSITVILGFLAGAYGKAFAIGRTAEDADKKATATEAVVENIKEDTASNSKDIENLFKIAKLQSESMEKLGETITSNSEKTNEKITDLLVEVRGLSVKIENLEKSKR